MDDATEPAPLPAPPATGNARIDEALRALEDLPASPLTEHHARLGAAQDLLGSVLDASRSAVASPIPEALRHGGTRG